VIRGHARSPALAGAELLLGAAIVIGHNVFGVVPNEVPILTVLAILSMRVHSGGWNWSFLGFERPDSWVRILGVALGAAVVRIVVGEWVVEPLVGHFWPPAKAPAGTDEIAGHFGWVLLYLPVIWGFAAFGEEICYRGYLLDRAAVFAGGSRVAQGAALLASAVLFGFGHYYKGPSGIIDSAVAGLILGAVYLLTRRNLWTSVLAHGFIDTFALIAAYFGWSD
jgi:uncharacterized protein